MEYRNLADAIVLQAVSDYRDALKKLRRKPEHIDALIMKNEVEHFFRSNRYRVLTDLDGELLIMELKKEAE